MLVVRKRLLINYINVLYRSYAYDSARNEKKGKRGTEARTTSPPKVHSLRERTKEIRKERKRRQTKEKVKTETRRK